MPAEQNHVLMARGKTVMEVKAMGSFAITHVNPADDPRNHGARAKTGT